jgi:hypothetical protein
MGAPGTNAVALLRAYEEAASENRAACLALFQKENPTPADLQRAEDARAAFATAKCAYYEAVLETWGTPERRALDSLRRALQIACIIRNDCTRTRRDARSPDLPRETAVRDAVFEARKAFVDALFLQLDARKGPRGVPGARPVAPRQDRESNGRKTGAS